MEGAAEERGREDRGADDGRGAEVGIAEVDGKTEVGLACDGVGVAVGRVSLVVGTVTRVEALGCEVGGAVEISVEMLLEGADVGTLVWAVDGAVFVFEVTPVEIPVDI